MSAALELRKMLSAFCPYKVESRRFNPAATRNTGAHLHGRRYSAVRPSVCPLPVLRPSGSRLSDPAYLLLSVRPLPVDSAASASSFAVPKRILFNDSSGKVQKIFAGGIPRVFAAPVRWERPK